MTGDELDDLILDHLDGGASTGLDRELAGNPAAGRRLAELALQENLLSELGDGRIAEPARSPVKWVSLAAAALIAALLLVFALRKEPPAPVVAEPIPPKPVVHALPPLLPETPKAPPPREEAPTVVVPPVPPPPPEPPKKPEPPAVVKEPAPKEEPKPVPTPPKSTPDAVVYKPVALTAVRGAAWRRSGGKIEPARAAMEIAGTDQLYTTTRRAATLTTSAGASIWLQKDTMLALDQKADGDVHVTVAAGAAFFSVEPRTTPFVVTTLDGVEAFVAGTSFLVERDEKRSAISVLDGTVRFRNDKGEVTIKAGQRSSVRAGEKPSTPAKADVEALAAWRLRPELAPNPERNPYSDFEPGANRKVAGLAIAAPYDDGEEEAGRLARAIAERLDAGLALGHHYRDLEKKRWINVDRGMEAEVRADGTLAAEAFTDPARRATAEYLDRIRAAAGVGPRDAVPMVVQVRTQYQDAEAGEVAVAGWNRATMAAAKAYYAQLLEKHKPAVRLELRFQGADKVQFTEDDARIEGYMAQRNARNAAAIFVPSAFGKKPENIDAYGRILGELIEFLYLRRR
jgi:hypothetical protein